MNMRVPISLQYLDFSCFGFVPRSGIAESSDDSIFNLLWNLHTVSIVAVLIYITSHLHCNIFLPMLCKSSLFSISSPSPLSGRESRERMGVIYWKIEEMQKVWGFYSNFIFGAVGADRLVDAPWWAWGPPHQSKLRNTDWTGISLAWVSLDSGGACMGLRISFWLLLVGAGGECRRELSLGPSGQPRSPCGEGVDGPLAEARMDHLGYRWKDNLLTTPMLRWLRDWEAGQQEGNARPGVTNGSFDLKKEAESIAHMITLSLIT